MNSRRRDVPSPGRADDQGAGRAQDSSTAAVVAMSDHEQALARLAKTYGTAAASRREDRFQRAAPVHRRQHGDAEEEALRDTQVELDGTVRHVSALDSALAGGNISERYAVLDGAGEAGARPWPPSPPSAAGGGGGGGGRLDCVRPGRGGGFQARQVLGHGDSASSPPPRPRPSIAAGPRRAGRLAGRRADDAPGAKAIATTATSIGPATGSPQGSTWGNGYRDPRYQNLATGGVYELGGAGINLAPRAAARSGRWG